MQINHVVKILTLLVFISHSYQVLSKESLFSSVNKENYYRWTIKSAKDQLVINKKKNTLEIESLDYDIIDRLYKSIKNKKLVKKYLKNVKFDNSNFPVSGSKIIVNLSGRDVDSFYFFKDDEKKYVIDFWKEEVTPLNKVTSKRKIASLNKNIKNDTKTSQKKEKSNKRTISSVSQNKKIDKKITKKETKKIVAKKYRDFRYGLPFVWDYKPMVPRIKETINIKSKIPEFLHKIKNIKVGNSKKKAHMQLSINLYRKGRYGLMSKSIKLYEEKYGINDKYDLNNYLRVNAILKRNLYIKNESLNRNAINILVNISERTKNYDLQKSVLQYLIFSFISEENYIKALEKSKKLYISSEENFDKEMAQYTAGLILFNLANLNQFEQIEDFLKDRRIKRYINKGMALSFKSYVHLSQNRNKQLIRKIEKVISKYSNEALMFNVGESYFRLGKYKKAIKIFDRFITKHPYSRKESHARLRIALSYDLLNDKNEKIEKLYKDAINNSSNKNILFESKLRYVAYTNARKIKLTPRDKEDLIFLNVDEEIKDKNLERSLWLIRLRTFINHKKFKEAFTYFLSLPLDAIPLINRKTFLSDTSEIINYFITEFYEKNDYSNVIKIWELYKNEYFLDVTPDPHLFFIVGKSFLNLKLVDSFDRSVDFMRKFSKSPRRRYPIWFKRNVSISLNNVINELNIIKNIQKNNWDLALALTKKFDDKELIKKHYLLGIIHYKLSNYHQSIESFENFILKHKSLDVLSKDELIGLIKGYSDSLYQTADYEKYIKVVSAFLEENSPQMGKHSNNLEVFDGLEYHIIEIMFGRDKDNKDFVGIEKKIRSHRKKYPKSVFKDRLDFLLAVCSVENNKLAQGEKILNELLNNQSVSKYLKELAKIELTSLKIRNHRI